MSSPTPSLFERVRWPEIRDEFALEHELGQHLSVVGPTGSGKSVLLIELAKARGTRKARDGHPTRMTYLAAKPKDRSLDALGWPRIRSWPPGYGQFQVLVWPPYGEPGTATARQRRIFRPLLDQIFVEGGQVVIVDEVARFAEPFPDGLGLKSIINDYETESRGNDLSFFGATQRPRMVPLSFWSEPTWLAIFKPEDEYDFKRIREIGGQRSGLEEAVRQLKDHEFVFIRRRGSTRKDIYVSKVEL